MHWCCRCTIKNSFCFAPDSNGWINPYMCHLKLIKFLFPKLIKCMHRLLLNNQPLHVSFDAVKVLIKWLNVCMLQSYLKNLFWFRRLLNNQSLHVSFDAAELFKEFVLLQTPIEWSAFACVIWSFLWFFD